ncbi:MAG: hypothetical protein ABEJ35_06500 [Halobacteriaceae archaeon]
MPNLPPRWLLAVIIAASIVIPGVANWALVRAGYPLLGDVVWILGFATMVGLVWWGWLRPLDIQGPSA